MVTEATPHDAHAQLIVEATNRALEDESQYIFGHTGAGIAYLAVNRIIMRDDAHGESPMLDVKKMSRRELEERALTGERRLVSRRESTKRNHGKKRAAGMIPKTVWVPAGLAHHVGPTIARMVAELTQAEADRASSVVPETPPVEWHFAQG